ncbi:MAG: hypothetical protein ACYTG2_17710 [Planctomycetota bacterium]|jgi:hypothetical protein
MRIGIGLFVVLLAGCQVEKTGLFAEGEDSFASQVVARVNPIATVAAFRAHREVGDLDRARALMSDDPRKWYEVREGEGIPWTLGTGGRWSAWDEHFRSESTYGDWHEEDDHVWADVFEINDYHRLTERGGGWWRATYFLDDEGLIEGFMVSAVPDKPSPRGRRDEFEAWAREHDPDEAEYLMPGGKLDPTDDRAPRMRALLLRWRAAAGLPRVDLP